MNTNIIFFYELRSDKLISFYQEIAKALGPEGLLITSDLAYPNDKAKPAPQKILALMMH